MTTIDDNDDYDVDDYDDNDEDNDDDIVLSNPSIQCVLVLPVA